jgi:mono/diheme cytochrome c family protein
MLVLIAGFTFTVFSSGEAPPLLRTNRSSPGDLEVGGELAGVAAGSTRFIRYEDLLQLPLETYRVDDDTNFQGATKISGVSLDTLAHTFGQSTDMIVAICYDHYRTNYPHDYVMAHHPLLVLQVNGLEREHWPSAESGGSMGPYLISHPSFKPSFKVLSHEDEPQIPYGVTRIEFRRESQVFGAIRPPGNWTSDSRVGQGYVIARQDCFRCHNMGREGGTMAGRSWLKLAAIANADGSRFRKIIHDPSSVRVGAKMPAHRDYDAATLKALTAYFKTFNKIHSETRARTRRSSTP